MSLLTLYPNVEMDDSIIKITRSKASRDGSRTIGLICLLVPLVFNAVEFPKFIARHDPLALLFPAIGGLIALLYFGRARRNVITLDLALGQYEQIIVPALWNRRSRGRMENLSVKSITSNGYNHVMLVDRSRRWYSVIAVGVTPAASQELAYRVSDMAHIPVEIVRMDRSGRES